jgi:predicted nucleotidyltransferase
LAAIPVEVENKIKRYLMALRDHDIPIRKAILFGSYARGNYHEWSDIDIALVSDVFVGNRMTDRKKIRKITLQIGSDIEPLPYNTKDFNEENPLAKEIIETGIEIMQDW